MQDLNLTHQVPKTSSTMQINEMHRSSLSIFEDFVNDPRTTNMRNKHYASIHKAVIVKRGIILAEANNNYGSRSRGSGYSRSSIHAEKNVVKALGDISKLKGADMYIMRFILSYMFQFKY